jgi:hypothetical protein
MANNTGQLHPPLLPALTSQHWMHVGPYNTQLRANHFLNPSAERSVQRQLAAVFLVSFDPLSDDLMLPGELYDLYQHIGLTVRMMEAQIGSRPIRPFHPDISFERQVEAVVWIRAVIRQVLDALVCVVITY